jgi:hypothetical protein
LKAALKADWMVVLTVALMVVMKVALKAEMWAVL